MRHPQTLVSDRAFLLNTCGRLWCAGVTIDWEKLSVGEQRRRLPLPTYPFERKRYWIEPAPQRHQDSGMIRLHKEPDLARWFSVPSWKRSPLPALPVLPPEEGQVQSQEEGSAPPVSVSCWLIFTDPMGLGTRLGEHLQAQ